MRYTGITSNAARLLQALGLGLASIGLAHAADPVPATASLVASSGAATPVQSTFTIAGPQDLVVTLTDLKNPAAFTSLGVTVIQGGQLAASFNLSAQTPKANLPAANGTYTISVFGAPDATAGAGTFSICVAPSATPANCLLSGAPTPGGNVASFTAAINATPGAQTATLTTTQYTLTVTAGGAYTVNYADLNFPVALSSSGTLTPNPNLALFSGANLVGAAFASGTTFNLAGGTYTLLAVAQADATAKSGSYGIRITGPATLLDVTVPVGQLTAPSTVNNPTSQSLSLAVKDYAFPGVLGTAGAMLTAGGTKVLAATAAGSPAAASAPAGALQLWTYAAAASTPGIYSVDLSAGASDLYFNAYGVAGSAGNKAYAFVTPALSANTAYQASAVDLQFPSILSALSFAVAHDGIVTAQSGGAPTIDFTPAANGAAVVLVSASAPASGSQTGNGLFDVNVQTKASTPQRIFDQTQAVATSGSFFDSRTVNVDTAGNYNVTLSDLQFPAAFGNLALAVTQGSQVVGKIFGGGNFTLTAPNPGAYRITFLATPQTSQFGVYSLSMLYALPSVTLSSSASSAMTGSSVTLSWTTANATSCTASGGNFTGAISPGSGSQGVKLDASTTFKLSCTGPAGTASGQTSVTATAPTAGKSGGGGSLDAGALGLMGLAATAAARRRRARPATLLH